MRKSAIFIFLTPIYFSVLYFFIPSLPPLSYAQGVSSTTSTPHLFKVQSIDTMKYSRDISRQVLNDPSSFKSMINKQMSLIAEAGATHVAIATPYDAHFLPVLRLWVASAREHHLSVWFRGNFSGWEGWFDYQKIGEEEHKALLKSFLLSNPNLFRNGDIFTPCPECENGGGGDPRETGKKDEYNTFLVSEKKITDNIFASQNKSIAVYPSMNADIARQIITKDTIKAFGGVILIDHYVRTTKQFAEDIKAIPQELDARIGFGEIGAPIPDLNGEMTQTQQAKYVDGLFGAMYQDRTNIPVVNYWVLYGGSTALVDDDGVPRRAYKVVQNYFKAVDVHGVVHDSLGNVIPRAVVSIQGSDLSTRTIGNYQIFVPRQYSSIIVSADGYTSATFMLSSGTTTRSIRHDFYLAPLKPSPWYSIKVFFRSLNKGELGL